MSGIPVVIAENGFGTPVRPVDSNAPVMTVAENGFGMPIVISDLGAPFVVESGSFSPASLFAASEPGIWLDPSDPATVFSDPEGTTQAEIGDPVALVLDKSGNENHATQPVVASRPILGRVPATGRRNLLTRTEEFDNTVWVGASNTNVQIVQNSALAPDGSMTAARYIAGLNAGISSGVSFGQRRDATVTGPHRGTVWVRGVGSTIGKTVRLWWWFSGGSAATGDNGTVTPVLTGDWQQITMTPSITTIGQAFFRLDTGSGLGSFLSGEEMEIWHPQFELGSTPTPYQRVGSEYDVTEAGVPSLHYLSFDGVDDFMETPIITPDTDKVQVFAGVRKLSDAAIGLLAEMGSTGNQDGIFNVAAPLNTTGSSYRLASRGTAQSTAVATGFGAPVSSIITGLGDISGDRATLRVDGVQVEQSTVDQGTGNYLAYPLYIGARAGTSLFFNGHIYSLITRFGPNLPIATIESVERHVAKHTGVSL